MSEEESTQNLQALQDEVIPLCFVNLTSLPECRGEYSTDIQRDVTPWQCLRLTLLRG